MADVKISGLPASTTPLAGTEVLPVVQSGATKQVSVANLTAGRAVSASALTAFGTGDLVNIQYSNNGAPAYLKWKQVDGTTLWTMGGGYVIRQDELAISRGATTVLYMDNANNVRVNNGNLIIGTSGKGIDFSATAGTGTSELLADYEEGTWTPTQGADLTVVGAFSSSGIYTKVGRSVTITGFVAGATSVAVTSIGVICGGLPFTIGSVSAVGSSWTPAPAVSAAYINTSTNNLTSVEALVASTTINFTVTYFV